MVYAELRTLARHLVVLAQNRRQLQLQEVDPWQVAWQRVVSREPAK